MRHTLIWVIIRVFTALRIILCYSINTHIHKKMASTRQWPFSVFNLFVRTSQKDETAKQRVLRELARRSLPSDMAGTLCLAFSFVNLSVSFCLVNLNSAQAKNPVLWTAPYLSLANEPIKERASGGSLDFFLSVSNCVIKFLISPKPRYQANQNLASRRLPFIQMRRSITRSWSTVRQLRLPFICIWIEPNYAINHADVGSTISSWRRWTF